MTGKPGTPPSTAVVDPASVAWAIASLNRHSDSDLFPRPIELGAFMDLQSRAMFPTVDLSKDTPRAPRRFIVPKDDLSYRAATQIDPFDSVILTTLMHQYGPAIEARRAPADVVFSYRYAPSSDGDLYASLQSWNSFWSHCLNLAGRYPHALVVDVADFYNQISHHTIENQLIESGLPNQAIKWVLHLLNLVSAKVSRGIPVGPHAAHLLAEASLIPVDNSLLARGVVFCRFVDDMVFFTRSEAKARETLYHVAETLDKQQRLLLQRSKTRVLTSGQLARHCASMIQDRPINDLERELIEIIRKHSGGNPYRGVFVSDLSDAELRSFREASVTKILDDYFAASTPDFPRLRWFLRRLAQVGHPAAVSYCLRRIDKLTPALSDVCHYFVAVSLTDNSVDWPSIGGSLLKALASPIIQSNDYFQLSLLGLFGREARLDHIADLLGMYRAAAPAVRREVILAAAACGAADWLRELKGEVPAMDPWTKRAFLCAARRLPSEERGFFLRKTSLNDQSEKLLADWAQIR